MLRNNRFKDISAARHRRPPSSAKSNTEAASASRVGGESVGIIFNIPN
jgi:hypothetical protein